MAKSSPRCSCERPSGGRTGRRISTGASSRTSASAAGGWFSVMSSTSERSAPPRPRRGERRSKSSTRTPGARARSPYSRRIAARSSTMPTSSACVCRRCGFVVRASGARAGSPASCGASCNSTVSGPSVCRQAAKGRAGTTCCRCWRRIGSYRPAASGGCTANGSSTAPWRTCSAAISASPRRTSSTPATTCCSNTNRLCSRI